MSTSPIESPWLIRIVDWSNPILVKELRQSLKSRQFVATFMLLVTAAWLVSVFGLLMFQTQVQYGPAGRFFFIGFYLALAVATLLIVPFNSSKSLQAERDFNTFEILSVTTITPQEIVRGRMLSSLVQCLIFYSAITPFMAFASTMQGFDSLRAAYILVVTLLLSMMLSMAALMISTMAKQRATQGLLSLILVGQLIGAVILACSLASTMTFLPWFSITDPIFWQANGAAFLLLLSYYVLFQQIASANLTFESANHSTGIRITAAVQFWMLWLVAFGYFAWTGNRADPEVFSVLAVVSIVHWAVFGLAFTAELDSLSRRIRRGFPNNPILRALMVPLLPGGARGYLYILFNIASLWLLYAIGMSYFVVAGRNWSGSGLWSKIAIAIDSQNPEFCVITGVSLLLIVYLGANTALARWGQMASDLVKPSHARVVTFLFLMAAYVGPQILIQTKLVRHDFGEFHFFQILDPFLTSQYVYSHQNYQARTILWALSFFALCAILVNSLAVWSSTRHVIKSRVRARKPSDITQFEDEA